MAAFVPGIALGRTQVNEYVPGAAFCETWKSN